MVDAVSGLDTLEWSAEARKQVILADRLVISKTDLADEQARRAPAPRVCDALNPRAAIHTAIDGELDPRCLIESERNARHPRLSAAPASLPKPSTATASRASSDR